ncbi:MAG: hypothetical protein GC131_03680 [Alphaproteobacteria bacterium]|nr:hypothetical protein [Alphaproteobacteria bacterium]
MKPPASLLLPLNPRHPPVNVEDLALMLEIDLALGRKHDFQRRLRKAIALSYRQGQAGRRQAPRC